MSKPPAFQFYADNFLGGTADMSAEEVGVYIRMLCQQWTKGSLPDDDFRLVILTGGKKKSIQVVRQKFVKCVDGLLRNERMEQVREEQEAFRAKQAQNGALGGRPKKNPSLLSGIPLAYVSPNPNHNPTPNPEKALQSSPSDFILLSTEPPKPPEPEPPKKAERESLRLRLGGWFHRRESTAWSEKELKSFGKLKPFDEDLNLLEWFFALPMPKEVPFAQKQPIHNRRHDLITLLNNWPGEVDKAKRQKALTASIFEFDDLSKKVPIAS